MSLAGRARTQGSRVTIYRSAEGETGDLGRKVDSWVVVVSGAPAIIESATDELMQKVFGTPAVAKDRISLPSNPDVRPGDAIRSTSGKRDGGKWRVHAVLTLDQRRPHKEAALESTTEAVGPSCALTGSGDGTCQLGGQGGCQLSAGGTGACVLVGE